MASSGEAPHSDRPEGESLYTDYKSDNPDVPINPSAEEIRKKIKAFYNLFHPSDNDRRYYEEQLRRLQTVFEMHGESPELLAARNRYWMLLTRDSVNTPLGPTVVDQTRGYFAGQNHLMARMSTAGGEYDLVVIVPYGAVDDIKNEVLGAHIYRVGERTTHNRFSLEPLWETQPRTSPLEIWYGDGPLLVAVCGGIEDTFSEMGGDWPAEAAKLDQIAERNRVLAALAIGNAA